MIVTIDGGSGTGKTSVAKKVAEKLGWEYFDTGALYRSFAYLVLKTGTDPQQPVALLQLLDSFTFEIQNRSGEKRYFVGGEDVSSLIRSREVTLLASYVASCKEVRQVLLKTQRDFARKGNCVFEGRDVGTVVFPDAEFKIFLTAAPLVRAQRRMCEMRSRCPEETRSLSEKELMEEMLKRDERDSQREIAPLKEPNGAYRIDTTQLSIEQVVEQIVEYVRTHS